MADTAGQAEIRGVDIQKVVEGFADVGVVLAKLIPSISATARELRWYSKTSGSGSSNFLSSPTTTGVTTDMIETASGALPVEIENSYTRNTNYVKKFFASSPMITEEDIKDSDPDVWGDLIRDTVISVTRISPFSIFFKSSSL